jgi:hypothetical protein
MSPTLAQCLLVALLAFELGYWLGDSRLRPLLTLRYWLTGKVEQP